MGARYYDAQVWAFISRDTHLDQLPYGYCHGNPVNAVDPGGHHYIKIKPSGHGNTYEYPATEDGVIIGPGGNDNTFIPVWPPSKPAPSGPTGGDSDDPAGPFEEGAGEAVGDKVMEHIIGLLETGLEF